ncbi:hypothetical protein CCMSSC00406_0003057 [Pleurotus cornucopiae]|uniref:Uncharacterized protein n=1 Tax=Pleurotus cornucopiae TaxID=5321 RepID=A0ACB7J4Q3_PLECO|nr:hypothetical protein CCMSSC00406_0003057 [Pleurotus cornucopiae]
MHPLTIPSAELAGILVESTLFGIYLLLFASCIYAYKTGRGTRSPTLLGINILMLILISSHWILQIVRLFDAFIYSLPLTSSDVYYSNVRDPKFVTKSALYFLQTTLGDLTMVYRLYVVWNRSWPVTILPLLAVLAYFVGGVVEINYFSQLAPQGGNFFTSTDPITVWVMIMFISSLFVTAYVTGLITWRIYSLRQVLQKFQLPVVNDVGVCSVIHALTESAVLYSAIHIAYNIAFILKSPFQLVALGASTPIIGISFVLVIVRASFRQHTKEYEMPTLNTIRASSAPTAFELNNLTPQSDLEAPWKIA